MSIPITELFDVRPVSVADAPAIGKLFGIVFRAQEPLGRIYVESNDQDYFTAVANICGKKSNGVSKEGSLTLRLKGDDTVVAAGIVMPIPEFDQIDFVETHPEQLPVGWVLDYVYQAGVAEMKRRGGDPSKAIFIVGRAVHESAQRKGVAGFLSSHFEDTGRKHGYTAMASLTTSPITRAMFLKRGGEMLASITFAEYAKVCAEKGWAHPPGVPEELACSFMLIPL
eukprot:PhF_6_TR1526/c0_g1_i4/m.2791